MDREQFRRDHGRLSAQTEAAIDGVMAGFAAEIGEIMASVYREGEPMTQADLDRISPRLNRAIARVYGPRRGVPGAIEKTIRERRQRAADLVFRRMMDGITREIERDPRLLAVVTYRTGIAPRR